VSLANAIATALWRSDVVDEEQARRLRADLEHELAKDTRRDLERTHRRQRRGVGRLARMVGGRGR
jgi:hypothetical protein